MKKPDEESRHFLSKCNISHNAIFNGSTFTLLLFTVSGSVSGGYVGAKFPCIEFKFWEIVHTWLGVGCITYFLGQYLKKKKK